MILSETKHDALYLSHYAGPHSYEDAASSSDLWNLHDARQFAHRYQELWFDMRGRRLDGIASELCRQLAAVALDVTSFTDEYPKTGRWRRPAIEAHLEAVKNLSV